LNHPSLINFLKTLDPETRGGAKEDFRESEHEYPTANKEYPTPKEEGMLWPWILGVPCWLLSIEIQEVCGFKIWEQGFRED
ncbi:hypothetical protein ACFLS1_06700, partial [Verrucomicrobiota bacterium]